MGTSGSPGYRARRRERERQRRQRDQRTPTTKARSDPAGAEGGGPRLLGELSSQLDDGRVYDRDLPALARELELVLEAHRRCARLTGAPDLY
jgi:hypothetical protein